MHLRTSNAAEERQEQGWEETAVQNFKRFLGMKTISHDGPTNGAYQEAALFLSDLCRELVPLFASASPPKDDFGSVRVLDPLSKGKPIVLATFKGRDESLPSVLLNGHYDVVAAMDEKWDTDPFEPFENERGDIFARGTQDMKCVCIQYLEALRLFLSERRKQQPQQQQEEEESRPFLRTIHVSFVPDEEIGGKEGMALLVQNEKLMKELNIGVALDEGLASPNDDFTVFYGERATWWCRIRATGPTGHGSRLVKNTAMEKLIRVVQHFLDYRAEQEARLDGHGCQHAVAKKEKLGDVATINLTMLRGGVTTDGGKTYAYNVIPSEAEAGFDIRIPPTIPLPEFEAMIQGWIASSLSSSSPSSNKKEDEGSITYEFAQKAERHSITSIDPEENPWWKTFHSFLEEEAKLKVVPEIFPAGTDSRYLRWADIPSFGFSPINNTPILLHDHNEFLNRKTFVRGVEIYAGLIAALANQPQ
ncbi:adenylate cyclase [Balamuthia mandrillaris]